MAKYRKKPVVIDAAQISVLHHCAKNDWNKLPEWVIDAYKKGLLVFLNNPKRVSIKTLEGTLDGSYDDWLIKGIQGELYPCKPDIFAATYEEVKDD